ncbi:hypothetical protein Salat_0757700 [Sesamum alatum]|uniref:Uncharacterized protein n=1 Tax=Sesamum alatum TaxID=300844 RepID=A0AAE1YTJ3_9LAMI|nr:hypothetical protein Salat_0757700 [Sesamum alatum]
MMMAGVEMVKRWCVYQEPSSSVYTKALYGLTLLGVVYLGISEAIGKHLQYAKFWDSATHKSQQILLPAKIGMLIFYTPSLLAGVSSFWVFSDGGGIRVLMLKFSYHSSFPQEGP